MSIPADLEARGRDIWAAYGADKLPAGSRALVHELARSADTLDRLDALVIGKREVWVELVTDDVGNVTLSVDGLLAERRQQQANFKQLMGEVRQLGLKQDGTAQVTPEDEEKENRGATILRLRDRMG